MKFLDILHKLGVVRGGSYSWKGDAKDRPTQAIMGDVYDTEKDLIHHKKSGESDVSSIKQIEKTKGKNSIFRNLFWIFFVLLLLLLFIYLLSIGFSFLFIIFLLLRIVFLWSLRRSSTKWLLSLWVAIVFGIIIVILSFVFIAVDPKDSNEDKTIQNTLIE